MRKEQEETGRGAVWKRAAHREPGMVGWDQFAWKPGWVLTLLLTFTFSHMWPCSRQANWPLKGHVLKTCIISENQEPVYYSCYVLALFEARSSLKAPQETDDYYYYYLHFTTGKMKHQEVKELSWGHTTRKELSQDMNPAALGRVWWSWYYHMMILKKTDKKQQKANLFWEFP